MHTSETDPITDIKRQQRQESVVLQQLCVNTNHCYDCYWNRKTAKKEFRVQEEQLQSVFCSFSDFFFLKTFLRSE